MKNNKHATFAKIFETGNIKVDPIYADKSFVLQGHGITNGHWNQSIELNMRDREFHLNETIHIRKHIGPFEKTTRNLGRFGDCIVIKYNTKNTKL